MAVSLSDYVGAGVDQTALVSACSEEAAALVARYIGTATVPNAVKDRAELEVGSELFHRQSAPNGIAQFQTLDASPVRVARDPMVGAYPLLAPFVGLGIA